MEKDNNINTVARRVVDILQRAIQGEGVHARLSWKQRMPEIHGELADLAYIDGFENDPIVIVSLDVIGRLYGYPDSEIQVILKFLADALEKEDFKGLYLKDA